MNVAWVTGEGVVPADAGCRIAGGPELVGSAAADAAVPATPQLRSTGSCGSRGS